MRILLSNDDGVEAPGLWALYQAVSEVADEVIVVAPSSERSAVGHAISVYHEVTLRRHIRDQRAWAYSLDGTPADCVKMALSTLMKDAPPDLVISGVNRGQNTGTSILYSGTVAAAREATMSGLPAIAVSLAVTAPLPGVEPLGGGKEGPYSPPPRELARRPEDYAVAARFAARLARTVARRGLPRGTLLNVNVPMLPEDRIQGTVISKMGQSVFIDQFKVMSEQADAVAYRNVGDRLIPSPEGDDWDDLVLHQGKISISPLHYDLTHHHFIEQLRAWMEDEEQETRKAGAQVADLLTRDLNAEVKEDE